MQFDCRIFIVAAAALAAVPAHAQTAPTTPAAPSTAQTPAADPIVARVGAEEIHLSDISAAAQGLPAQYHNMSSEALYPLLLDQAIDRDALVAYARSKGLDKDLN